MTTAVFRQDENEILVQVTGHADHQGPNGDIVCAACSTLAYTLLQCLLTELRVSGGEDIHYRDISGHMVLSASTYASDDATRERISVLMSMAAAGYALLEVQYPEHVKLVFQGGEKKYF